MACTNQPNPVPPPCSSSPEPGNPPGVRALVGETYFTGAVHTVLDNNPGMEASTAERIVTEAIKFVCAASLFPKVRIAPTRVVDEGWHALILHTHPYDSFCNRLGRKVHHYPERPDASRHDPDVITRTMALIEQAGYTVDSELWVDPQRSLVTVAANCSHTQKPGGCGPINPGGCASMPPQE